MVQSHYEMQIYAQIHMMNLIKILSRSSNSWNSVKKKMKKKLIQSYILLLLASLLKYVMEVIYNMSRVSTAEFKPFDSFRLPTRLNLHSLCS